MRDCLGRGGVCAHRDFVAVTASDDIFFALCLYNIKNARSDGLNYRNVPAYLSWILGGSLGVGGAGWIGLDLVILQRRVRHRRMSGLRRAPRLRVQTGRFFSHAVHDRSRA